MIYSPFSRGNTHGHLDDGIYESFDGGFGGNPFDAWQNHREELLPRHRAVRGEVGRVQHVELVYYLVDCLTLLVIT